MECLRCGADLGNKLGLCPRCAAERKATPPPLLDMKKNAEDAAALEKTNRFGTRRPTLELRREADPAGFWLRLTASLIDGAILSTLNLALSYLILTAIPLLAPAKGSKVLVPLLIGLPIAAFLGISAIFFVYFALFESSRFQATPGKAITGLSVLLPGGERVSFARALVRNLLKIVSALIFGIGYLMAAFTPHKQALHDMLAGVHVVRGPNYTPYRAICAVCVALIASGVTLLANQKLEKEVPRLKDKLLLALK